MSRRNRQASRRTSCASLSSLRATNRECRRWLSGVHSTYSNCPTNTGFNQRHSFILSAVRPCPQRPPRASGRFTNGHFGISRPWKRRCSCALRAGVNPLRVLAGYRACRLHSIRRSGRQSSGALGVYPLITNSCPWRSASAAGSSREVIQRCHPHSSMGVALSSHPRSLGRVTSVLATYGS